MSSPAIQVVEESKILKFARGCIYWDAYRGNYCTDLKARDLLAEADVDSMLVYSLSKLDVVIEIERAIRYVVV
jgi:hypothetical protein